MKKLIRAVVPKGVLKKFDSDVNCGRRAAKIEAVMDKFRKELKERSRPAKSVDTPQVISVLLEEADLELLHKVAKVERSSVSDVMGEIIARSV